MKKINRDECGFLNIEILIGAIVIALLVVVGFYVHRWYDRTDNQTYAVQQLKAEIQKIGLKNSRTIFMGKFCVDNSDAVIGSSSCSEYVEVFTSGTGNMQNDLQTLIQKFKSASFVTDTANSQYSDPGDQGQVTSSIPTKPFFADIFVGLDSNPDLRASGVQSLNAWAKVKPYPIGYELEYQYN